MAPKLTLLMSSGSKKKEPCYFAEVPDGPQTYTLDVLWLQEGAQIHMSVCSQSFTFTNNVGRDFFLFSTPPEQWTV